MNTLSPVIEQLHRAGSDQERASVLLRSSDAVLLKYSDTFLTACRRVAFDAGALFVNLRLAVLFAVRDEAGALPADLARDLEAVRGELAAYAAGAPVYAEMEVSSGDPPG